MFVDTKTKELNSVFTRVRDLDKTDGLENAVLELRDKLIHSAIAPGETPRTNELTNNRMRASVKMSSLEETVVSLACPGYNAYFDTSQASDRLAILGQLVNIFVQLGGQDVERVFGGSVGFDVVLKSCRFRMRVSGRKVLSS
jgi:hypothetical protein